jgi:hypothetical protein
VDPGSGAVQIVGLRPGGAGGGAGRPVLELGAVGCARTSRRARGARTHADDASHFRDAHADDASLFRDAHADDASPLRDAHADDASVTRQPAPSIDFVGPPFFCATRTRPRPRQRRRGVPGCV